MQRTEENDGVHSFIEIKISLTSCGFPYFRLIFDKPMSALEPRRRKNKPNNGRDDGVKVRPIGRTVVIQFET
jgi:hypothetical protein